MESKTDKTSRLLLSGPIMLQKWLAEIGFSDPKTISKYDLWTHLGFYIPQTTHPERKIILSFLNKIHNI